MKKKKYIKCIFLLKTLLVALPVIVLITFYVVKDPFMILREYDDYDHRECVLTNVGYIIWLKFK